MFFSLFRVSMDFVEDIRVSQKRIVTGFGAEINRPASIYGAREIGRVRVAEDPPAQGDEAWMFLLLRRKD